jgi:hypothetical protein
MEMIIENATCYELECGAQVERQEHCDFWWENGYLCAGTAEVYDGELYFRPFDITESNLVDYIVRYSYDYGETWEEMR